MINRISFGDGDVREAPQTDLSASSSFDFCVLLLIFQCSLIYISFLSYLILILYTWRCFFFHIVLQQHYFEYLILLLLIFIYFSIFLWYYFFFLFYYELICTRCVTNVRYSHITFFTQVQIDRFNLDNKCNSTFSTCIMSVSNDIAQNVLEHWNEYIILRNCGRPKSVCVDIRN